MNFFLRTSLELACGVIFALRATGEPSAEGTAPVRLTGSMISDWVEEARTNHPALRAADQRRRAADRGVASVRTWEDPMFRFGGVVTTDRGPNLEMEGDLLYMVQQPIPLFGKAQAMRREAQASMAVSAAEADYRFQIVRLGIVQAVHDLALADETVAIGTEDLALLERMSGFARERQRAGLDSAVELLRLENEVEKRRVQLETDRQQREFLRVTANRQMARPQPAEWAPLRLPEPAPAIPLSERLFEMGRKFEPRLRVMRQEIEMAEMGVEVARRNRHPEVSLGVEGRQWSGTGDFREGMFTVAFSVPWFNRGKYRADVDRGRARAEAVRAEAEDYELDVRRELFRIWSRIDAARREALLYRDVVIPRSALVVENTLAAWTAGRGMFLDVLEARRMLTDARLMGARAVAEQHRMIAELITCCGVAELDSLIMLETSNP